MCSQFNFKETFNWCISVIKLTTDQTVNRKKKIEIISKNNVQND